MKKEKRKKTLTKKTKKTLTQKKQKSLKKKEEKKWYLSCGTCKKYGRTKHQDDIEKEAGCHMNSGYVDDEKEKSKK